MNVSLIVAISRTGVIGRDNALPWHLPEDLKRFKSLSMGHHLIMGRRTFQSLGRLLPGRTTVVVTRDRTFQFPGAVIVHSFPDALHVAAGDDEVFVIGGAEIFLESIACAQRVYVTRVLVDCDGDTVLDLDRMLVGWKLIRASEVLKSEKSGIPYRYEDYERALRTK
jgi:dihydrofolate reductase